MPRKNRVSPPDSVPASQYPQWFKAWAEKQESAESALDWLGSYAAADLKRLLLAVLEAGGAIFIGLTRDKGAVRITVMFGDAKKTVYAASPIELADIMGQLS